MAQSSGSFHEDPEVLKTETKDLRDDDKDNDKERKG